MCVCDKVLYSIGAWADNRVTEIKYVPKYGNPISWSVVNGTLNASAPTNTNHWNMQSPVTSAQFPIFPLCLSCGDRFIFTFNNDLTTPNAFACSANINGVIYRTANNTVSLYPDKITLKPTIGFSIVNPSYSPTTDLMTRNIINTVNYISISPNTASNFTLTWLL
jgi:hypothetical protein